MTEELEHNA